MDSSWLGLTVCNDAEGVERAGGGRAQSETVGVIMLTAVIVVLMGGFGAVYLGATGEAASDGPLVTANVTATADRVSITHAGGDSVRIADLDVLVRGSDASERHSFDVGNVSDTADDRFDPGERYARNHGVGGGQLQVLLVHTESNTVLEHAYLDT